MRFMGFILMVLPLLKIKKVCRPAPNSPFMRKRRRNGDCNSIGSSKTIDMKEFRITLAVLMIMALTAISSPSFAQNSTENDANRSAMSNHDHDGDRDADHHHGNWGWLGLLGLAGLAGLRKGNDSRAHTTRDTGPTGRTGV